MQDNRHEREQAQTLATGPNANVNVYTNADGARSRDARVYPTALVRAGPCVVRSRSSLPCESERPDVRLASLSSKLHATGVNTASQTSSIGPRTSAPRLACTSRVRSSGLRPQGMACHPLQGRVGDLACACARVWQAGAWALGYRSCYVRSRGFEIHAGSRALLSLRIRVRYCIQSPPTVRSGVNMGPSAQQELALPPRAGPQEKKYIGASILTGRP